ncbi:MAG: hypothetical protein C0600_04250 [Ignavibacteria bacterium]|nr:MAG: hypothetical protein C0600_04250 [Ignavibacteria bacterium]
MQRFLTFLLLTFFVILLYPFDTAAMDAERATRPEVDKPKPVTVYYFHTNRRCKTCLAIERISRGVVKDSYGDDKRVQFRSVNIEKEKNAALAERFEVAGSSLIVSCGKKSTDLTTKAFTYAGSSPGKLQAALIKTIKKYLK